MRKLFLVLLLLDLFLAACNQAAGLSDPVGTYSMLWKGAGKTTATLEGSTLTLNNEGILFAYRR